jgi:hypothetical protein
MVLEWSSAATRFSWFAQVYAAYQRSSSGAVSGEIVLS